MLFTMERQAILLMSHFFNESIEGKYHRLCKDLENKPFDIFLLLNVNDKSSLIEIPSYIKSCVYDIKDLNSLEYTPIYETLLPGSCHFPVLKFYKEHTDYSFYWFIEYDVEFTASWNLLMDAYTNNEADYIVSYWAKYEQKKNSKWNWWKTGNNCGYPIEQCLRAFHPICRYSNKALDVIDKYQSEGHSAHSELIIPTCIYHNGLDFAELSEGKEFVRYRPVYTVEELEDKYVYGKLYHPVK